MPANTSLAAAIVALAFFASASLAAGESQAPASPGAKRLAPSTSAPAASARNRPKPSSAKPLHWDAVDPRTVERAAKTPPSRPGFPAERQ
jgi:hypothetical protein